MNYSQPIVEQGRSNNMNLQDLLDALKALCPNASIGDDNYGQVVIFTNKVLTEDMELEEMVEEEED
jgi:hypothetical protein